jgi:hypothetical protein
MEEQRRTASLPGGSQAAAVVQSLLPHVPRRHRIESFWEQPEHQTVDSWTEHEDINAVMLATSLLPDGYLGPGSLRALRSH